MTPFRFDMLKDRSSAPLDILLLADPDRDKISAYVRDGQLFGVFDEADVVVGCCVVVVDNAVAEICNIALKESLQARGLGTQFMRFVLAELGKKPVSKVIVGTGNSSIDELAFYQKCGFELSHIRRNYFLETYREPIFENGIQCKHQLVFELTL